MSWLQALLYPLFLLRLLVLLGSFLLQLIWSLYRYPLLMTATLVLVLLNSLIYIEEQLFHDWRLYRLQQAENRSLLIERQNVYEELLQLQPTHAELLLNLSRVSSALGETERAQLQKQRANQLSPRRFFQD